MLSIREKAQGEAELHRLKGKALLTDAGTVSEADAAIQQGLAVARGRNAKSSELRCAAGPAHLWRKQGRHEDAFALLAPGNDRFPKGFDTADLWTTRVLPDELAGTADAAVKAGFRWRPVDQ
jgi:hypothetical protein